MEMSLWKGWGRYILLEIRIVESHINLNNLHGQSGAKWRNHLLWPQNQTKIDYQQSQSPTQQVSWRKIIITCKLWTYSIIWSSYWMQLHFGSHWGKNGRGKIIQNYWPKNWLLKFYKLRFFENTRNLPSRRSHCANT
jgi:hypothetical protein